MKEKFPAAIRIRVGETVYKTARLNLARKIIYNLTLLQLTNVNQEQLALTVLQQ